MQGNPAGHECLRINSDEIEKEINQQQCNLDFVTLLISAKTVTNCIMSLNRMILCSSKLKNSLFKIVTKSKVVTEFNVPKLRLNCTYFTNRISELEKN